MDREQSERSARKFTRAEVRASSNASCSVRAVIIDNLVYDVSEFLEEHPGGAEVLLGQAGGDASQCFRDVGHSDTALEWRKRFLVGELVAAEWSPVLPPLEPGTAAAARAREPLTLAALLNVWGPPAVLALLATAFYTYLL